MIGSPGAAPWLSTILLSVGLAACSRTPRPLAMDAMPATSAVLEGTASYRERMALPPGAVFEAQLEDVSRADAPGEVIGRTSVSSPGNPPIHFSIDYDPVRIQASHAYVIRARILVGGSLFFTTDQSYPVLTRGSPSTVSLLLRRAAGMQPADDARAMRVPATFIGTMPCGDCPGINLTLTLMADSTYRLRQVYQERPTFSNELGRWALADNGSRLVLNGGTEGRRQFAVLDADTLRLLDAQGRPIPPLASFSLTRATGMDWVHDSLRLVGTYTSMADAGRFTECITGRAYPVARAGADATLERAYANARGVPGAPLLVVITGHFEERESLEGGRLEEQLVVDQVERVGPESECERRLSNATLEDTYWKVAMLGAQPARVVDHVPEPHLLLHPAQSQASGSTGCNRFSGSYQLSGDSLRFDQLISTLRACVDPELNRQERLFLEALNWTRTWRVSGDTLLLSGAAGPVARFVAGYLR